MNKNISYRSSELLEKLNSRGKKFFTIEDANDLLTNSERETVKRLLIYMAKRGLILRIKDGLYNIIPYEENPKTYFPNWHLTAEQLVKPAEYYIGFYSAMDIHGLITQPSLIEQIVAKKQFHPKIKTVRKVKFEFIKFPPKRFFGYNKVWINDFEKVNCSDIEKTIIDSLFKPDYSAGIVEITKAIYRAKDKINCDRMLGYLSQFEIQSVNKRMGFILSALDLLPDLRNEISKNISESYTLLEPSLPKKGKYISRWRIVDNLNIYSALNSLET